MRHKYLPSFVKRRGRITKSQEDNLNALSKYEVKNYSQIINAKKKLLKSSFRNRVWEWRKYFRSCKQESRYFIYCLRGISSRYWILDWRGHWQTTSKYTNHIWRYQALDR